MCFNMRLLQKLCPWTIVVAKRNVTQPLPAYLQEKIRITTRKKIYVLCKKIKNIYETKNV